MRTVEKHIQPGAGCFKPGIESTTLEALRNLAEPVTRSRVVDATTGQKHLYKPRRLAKRVPRTKCCLQSLRLRLKFFHEYRTNGRRQISDSLS